MAICFPIVRIAVALLVLGCHLSLLAQTSRNSPHLKRALERYPAADANQDGILTRAEALAFRSKARPDSEGSAVRNPGGQEQNSGRRFIYKKVAGRGLALDIYYPRGHGGSTSATVPAMVFFHGGGWSSGNPKQFEPLCQYLSARGMVAISVEYRLVSQPGVKLEDCIEDAKSAMRWVRGNAPKLGIDPRRIGAGGGSAGGHLAAATALVPKLDAASDDVTVSAVPNALVLFNPVLAIEGEEMKQEVRRRKNLTRGSLEECMPLLYGAAQQPPCVMFFGTEDPLLAGAELFRTKSVGAGNRCEILTYAGQNHGFFNPGHARGKYFDLTAAEMEKFLRGLGWLSPVATARVSR